MHNLSLHSLMNSSCEKMEVGRFTLGGKATVVDLSCC